MPYLGKRKNLLSTISTRKGSVTVHLFSFLFFSSFFWEGGSGSGSLRPRLDLSLPHPAVFFEDCYQAVWLLALAS